MVMTEVRWKPQAIGDIVLDEIRFALEISQRLLASPVSGLVRRVVFDELVTVNQKHETSSFVGNKLDLRTVACKYRDDIVRNMFLRLIFENRG